MNLLCRVCFYMDVCGQVKTRPDKAYVVVINNIHTINLSLTISSKSLEYHQKEH